MGMFAGAPRDMAPWTQEEVDGTELVCPSSLVLNQGVVGEGVKLVQEEGQGEFKSAAEIAIEELQKKVDGAIDTIKLE